jgi:hypothetical protein
MWSKRALSGAALAALLSFPAHAQIEDSWLEQVDPWGISYLAENEPALPTGMWRGARGEDLLALMQTARTRGLTPAEQMLMRRLALSAGRAPTGEDRDGLLAERARIAFELGEAAAAAGQLSRLDVPPPGMDPAAVAADLNLVLGNEATACESLTAPDLEGDYWAKLRAVCAALSGNTSSAELAMEMAQTQGVKDNWLASAIFAMSGVTPNPPKAKFDTGLDFAMSTRAVLEVTPAAVPEDRPDIAAAMARRKLMPPTVRVKAAQLAAEAGLISAEEFRIAYNSALSADGFEPSTPLGHAVFVAADGTTSEAEKSDAIAAALEEASDSPARFVAASGLLKGSMARLSRDDASEATAFLFARASIAAGERSEAIRWATPPEPEPEIIPAEDTPDLLPDEAADPVEAEAEADAPDADASEQGAAADDLADPAAENLFSETEPAPEPEPAPPTFALAWISALAVLSDAEADKDTINDTARMLMDAARSEGEMQEAARMFALWAAAGTPPPSDARAFLSAESPMDDSASAPGDTIAVLAASRSGTAAEVILRALILTNGDPSELGLVDLSLVLNALQSIGAEDAARLLALEATGYWKSDS